MAKLLKSTLFIPTPDLDKLEKAYIKDYGNSPISNNVFAWLKEQPEFKERVMPPRIELKISSKSLNSSKPIKKRKPGFCPMCDKPYLPTRTTKERSELCSCPWNHRT